METEKPNEVQPKEKRVKKIPTIRKKISKCKEEVSSSESESSDSSEDTVSSQDSRDFEVSIDEA